MLIFFISLYFSFYWLTEQTPDVFCWHCTSHFFLSPQHPLGGGWEEEGDVKRFLKSTSRHARKPQLWADLFKAAEHKRPEGSGVRVWVENSWQEISGNRWIRDVHVKWITMATADACPLFMCGWPAECCCSGQHRGQLPRGSSAIWLIF